MARSPLYDSIVTEDSAKRLVGIPGALIQVYVRGTLTPVTVYDSESGGSGDSGPIEADSLGRFTGWVDPGQYTLSITVNGSVAGTTPLDVAVGESTIPDSLDLAPPTVEPIIDMTPKTTGVFFEFDKGATGVPLSTYDPPQSNYYNGLNAATATGLTASSLTYDNTGLLSGLPGSMRVSTNGKVTVGTCTISNATPGVVTKVAHGLAVGDRVVFTTTGALPTGLTAGTVYYVLSAGLTADAFEVSLTNYGQAINTSSAGSGVHTITRAGTGATYFTCNDPDFVATEDHYGTLYLYLDVLNTVNVRPIEWLTEDGNICGFLRVTTANKVAFFDKSQAQVTGTSSIGGAGVNVSSTALSAATWYRLEWHLDSTITDATNSTVTIRIYVGHSTTVTETLTFTAVDLRDSRGTLQIGNPSNALLAGKDYRISAVAEGGTDWFGPYGTAPRQIVSRIQNTDGDTMFEFHSDGSLVKNIDRTISIQPGGSTHGQSFRGTTGFKVDPLGSVAVGGMKNYGSTVDWAVSKLYDIFLNASTGRISASSADFTIFNDPSDIAMSRKFPMYPSNRVGTGAATTNGSATVTFTDLTLELLDIGRYCTIGGTGCHITSLNSATSCEMDTTFGATASGLAWMAKEHPYPGARTKGVTGTQSHIGQLRLTVPFTPFIRKSTIGTCTISNASPAVITKSSHGLVTDDPVVFTTTGGLPTGLTAGTTYYVSATGLSGGSFHVSATVGGADINTSSAGSGTHTVKRPLANVTSGSGVIANMPGFTAADIGRAIMFGGLYTRGEYVISAVGATTITVANILLGTPQFTDAACSWNLSGGDFDQEVRVDWQPWTLVFGTAGGGARVWDTASGGLYSAPSFCEFTMSAVDTNEDSVGTGLSSGGGSHAVMKITGGDDLTYGRGVHFGGHAHVIDAGKTIGYRPGLGVGANVNQATSKVTGVTINATSGRITTFNDALNAGLFATFTVTNSYVLADDIIILNIKSGRTGTYRANIGAVADGSFEVVLQNYSGSNQSDNVAISFAIIKGAGTT